MKTVFKYELRQANGGRDDYGHHVINEMYCEENNTENRMGFMNLCGKQSENFIKGISEDYGFYIKEVELKKFSLGIKP